MTSPAPTAASTSSRATGPSFNDQTFELFASIAGKPAFASLSAKGLGILTGPSAVKGASLTLHRVLHAAPPPRPGGGALPGETRGPELCPGNVERQVPNTNAPHE
jgi:hypothetical protein